MKKCIYTVIFGGYDQLLPPKVISEGFDHICFSDDPELKSDVWQIKLIEVPENHVKRQREVKILSHKYLPEYDITIYVDGNQQILADLNAMLQFYNGGMLVKKHPHRANIYDEALKIIQVGKAKQQDVELQVAHYRNSGFDEKYLFETGIMIRDNSEAVKKLCEAWWHDVDKFTYRDQLSLPPAVHNTGILLSVFGNTLTQKYFRIHRHIGRRMPISNVYYSTPAASDKNIGRAYNEFCGLVPDPEDWIVLRDGDTMFLTPHWMKQIEDVISIHGQHYQLFGCMTNRLASQWQRPNPANFDDPNILNHAQIAHKLLEEKYSVVTNHNRQIAGMFMMFQKKTWDKIKFRENSIYFDTEFSHDVISQGGKIGLMQGLYLFHFYRFDRVNPTKNVSHLI